MDDAQRDQVEAQRAGALADELRRIHDEEAALQARKLRLLAEAFALSETQKARIPSTRSKERDMPLRALAAELGLAVRTSDRTMQSHMWDAHRLTTSFAATVTALEQGRIARGHVSVILDTGATLDDPTARSAFERAVLDYAETTTPARTRAYAKQQADIHNPLTLQERHDLAAQGRRIWVTDLDDSMSILSQLLPTVIAHGILDRTTQQARLIKRVDGQRRRAVLAKDRTDAAATAASDTDDAGVAAGLAAGLAAARSTALDSTARTAVASTALTTTPPATTLPASTVPASTVPASTALDSTPGWLTPRWPAPGWTVPASTALDSTLGWTTTRCGSTSGPSIRSAPTWSPTCCSPARRR